VTTNVHTLFFSGNAIDRSGGVAQVRGWLLLGTGIGRCQQIRS